MPSRPVLKDDLEAVPDQTSIDALRPLPGEETAGQTRVEGRLYMPSIHEPDAMVWGRGL
jgi:hypothetical protein